MLTFWILVYIDVLYVTSSAFYLNADQLAAQPTAGALFKVTNIGTRGISAGIPYTRI